MSFIDKQTINCVAYGPFDNGHILLGLSDGWLLAYEYPSLERIESKQIFWPGQDGQSRMSGSFLEDNVVTDNNRISGGITEPLVLVEEDGPLETSVELQEDHAIVSIQIDPTNLILACSQGG